MAFLSFRRCQWHSFWSAGVANKAGATTGGAGIVAWCFQKQGHATREWATFHVWKPAGKGGVARRLPLDKLVDEGMVRSFISHVTSSEMHLQIIVHRPLLPEFVLVELGREVIQSTNTVSSSRMLCQMAPLVVAVQAIFYQFLFMFVQFCELRRFIARTGGWGEMWEICCLGGRSFAHSPHWSGVFAERTLMWAYYEKATPI